MESPSPSPRRLRPTDVLKNEHRQIEVRLQELSETLRLIGFRGAEPELLAAVEENTGPAGVEQRRVSRYRRERDVSAAAAQTTRSNRVTGVDEIRSAGGSVHGAVLDVTDAHAILRVVDEVRTALGLVRRRGLILVCC